MSKSLTVDNSTIKFQIWDTAGQERVCSNSSCIICHMILQYIGQGLTFSS